MSSSRIIKIKTSEGVKEMKASDYELNEEELDDIFDMMRADYQRTRETKIDVVSHVNRNVPDGTSIISDVSGLMRSAGQDGVEVELSFGDYKRSFIPGVSFREFNNLRQQMLAVGLGEKRERTIVYIKDAYRSVYNVDTDTTRYEAKLRNRQSQVENREWGWRLSESTEQPLTDEQVQTVDFSDGLRRQRDRLSFDLEDGVRLEMTRVDTGFSTSSRSYEVELEFSQSLTKAQLEKVVKRVLQAMQDDPTHSLLSLSQRSAVVHNYNALFASESKYRYPHGQLYKLANKPVPLDIPAILRGTRYHVTPKFDGVRKFVFFDSSGVYALSVDANSVEKISVAREEYTGTVLDCEWMNDQYYVFDVLFYKRQSLLKVESFAERIANTVDATYLKTKPFFFEDSFFASVRQCFAWMDEHPEFEYDGFIAQPESAPYKNSSTGKWKPSAQMTIDLRVDIRDGEDTYRTSMLTPNGEILFTGSREYLIADEQPAVDEIRDRDGQIVEFALSDDGGLRFYRARDDKDTPNFVTTVIRTWNDMHRPISREALLGETLYFYRRYANQRKLQLIQSETPKQSRVLDIGIGRGGDISKWNDPVRVYGVDPDRENLKEFESRLMGMANREAFTVAELGGEDTEYIMGLMGGEPVDVVASFFSLTFFFKSKSMLDRLLETIDQALAKGGKFIGTTADGERMGERLDWGERVIDNPFVRIEASDRLSKTRTFGNEIQIDFKDQDAIVKQQTEYLVAFDYLRERLEKLGFVMRSGEYLDEGAEVLPTSLRRFAKLNRSFVFERERDGVVEEEEISVPFDAKPLRVLAFGEKRQVVLGDEIYERHGVVRGNNAFFHSVFYLLGKNYRKMYTAGKKRELTEYVCEQRRLVGQQLTRDTFDRLLDGNVAHNIAYDLYSTDTSTQQAKDEAFAQYTLRVRDCDSWIGADIALALAERGKVHIHVHDLVTERKLYVTDNQADHHVHVLAIGNESFEPLTRNGNYKHLLAIGNES